MKDAANATRVEIYRSFIEERRAPTSDEIADALSIDRAEVEDALRELHAQDVIALRPGSTEIWLAHPFSSADEPFKVRTDAGQWDAICVWDALGVLAILETDGDVHTACPDCGEEITLSVRANALAPTTSVVHFGVPAARWYEDIAYT